MHGTIAEEPGPIYYIAMFGVYETLYLRKLIERANVMGIRRLLVVTDSENNHCSSAEGQWMQSNGVSRLLCLAIRPAFHDAGPYDINNKQKFEFLPFMLTLGATMVWLDADIYLY